MEQPFVSVIFVFDLLLRLMFLNFIHASGQNEPRHVQISKYYFTTLCVVIVKNIKHFSAICLFYKCGHQCQYKISNLTQINFSGPLETLKEAKIMPNQ